VPPDFVTVAVMWIPWVLLIDLDTTELVTVVTTGGDFGRTAEHLPP
jgi:hypothetical protein